MNKISAFVGHSFEEADKEIVRIFLDYFDSIKNFHKGFTWENAKTAEPKTLSEKVKARMEGKDLFIGICTIKEQTIGMDKLEIVPENDGLLKANKIYFEFKTSDWITQEIGYALGKGMDLMILLENGSKIPGGLQGDMEYIEFNRKEPEKSFSKILEMFSPLIAKLSHESISVAEKTIGDKIGEKETINDGLEYLTPSDCWGYNEYSFELFKAIIKKDKQKEQEVFDTYLQSKDVIDFEKIRLEAERLYYCDSLNKDDNLNKLNIMHKKYPKHSYVHYYLANLYEHYEDFKKASELYLIAANLTEENEDKLSYYIMSAKSLAKTGDKINIDLILMDAKKLRNSVVDGDKKILKAMAEISDATGNYESYLAFTEAILDISPEDHEDRFSLAYKYSDLKDNHYALFHYKLLAKQTSNDWYRSKWVWNNLGVAFGGLGLKGKSIRAFRESEKMNCTLAMSNLAYKLIDNGFFNEAGDICNQALQIENYDKKIASAISKINELSEEEDKKEIDILAKINKRRFYYIEYACACLKQPPLKLFGRWKAPEYELDIIVVDNQFEANGNFERKRSISLAEIALGRKPISPEISVCMEVKINGELIGHGIKYKLVIREKGTIPTLLTGNATEGFMIISDDVSEIKVYQKGNEDTERFYNLIRMP